MWDVQQYEKFRDERSQPFLDLLARVPDGAYTTIVDLGCGTGELTRILCDRWSKSRVTGVDSSDEMLAAAATRSMTGRLDFVKGNVGAWSGGPFDLVISNATLQWVPDHDRLLPHLRSMIAPGGVIAVQMPGNFDAPSHTILKELSAPRLREWRAAPVQTLAWYVERLWSLGLDADAWETTYLHVLHGEDAVLEWVKGTALRPVLAQLNPADHKPLMEAYAARLREAYPATPRGTLFPFRRLFFVARAR